MKRRYDANVLNLVQDAFYQVSLAASRCFPRYITRPFPRSRLQGIRHADPRENARHAPPSDEFIDLCSVWAIEFYTPAHIDELLNSLERLGWSEQHEPRNPVSWLKHRKASQFSQAWMPLGPVIPRRNPDVYIRRPLRADLPPSVICAYADMYCFTPSLVAIAIGFAFDEDYGRVFDYALRQDRQSYVTPTPGGYRIHDPGNQKKSHIQEIRRDTTQLIADWFSENIPGLCSTGLLGGNFPTCEFVTLRKAQPFPTIEENDDGFLWYMHHLGLSNSDGSWESARMAGLRFYPSHGGRNTTGYHSILSINEVGWTEQDPEEENGRSRESKIYSMHRRVSGMLGVWAIEVLLQGYAQHFRKLRNSEFLRSTQHESAVQALRRICESVSYSVDIAAVTDELTSLVRTKRPLGIEIEPFVPRSDAPDYWWKGSLDQLIQREVGENAKWLQSMDSAVRSHLTQYGTILGTVEDIRLQKKITLLTYAMLFLTGVLAILTYLTASEHFPWLRTIWNSLSAFLS